MGNMSVGKAGSQRNVDDLSLAGSAQFDDLRTRDVKVEEGYLEIHTQFGPVGRSDHKRRLEADGNGLRENRGRARPAKNSKRHIAIEDNQ